MTREGHMPKNICPNTIKIEKHLYKCKHQISKNAVPWPCSLGDSRGCVYDKDGTANAYRKRKKLDEELINAND